MFSAEYAGLLGEEINKSPPGRNTRLISCSIAFCSVRCSIVSNETTISNELFLNVNFEALQLT